jgi:hypothetical protein
MASVRSSARDYTYYDSVNHYTLTLPDGWEEIPKAIIVKAVSNAMSQSVSKSDFADFDAGFHLKNKGYFEYPYILIQNYEINTPTYNQIEKELAGSEMPGKFEKTLREYENLVSNASAKNPYLDKVRNMVFMNAEADVHGIGKVKSLTIICLGRERAIRIFFYSVESEYLQNLPIFMSILDSFKYNQGYEYSESKAGNNYSKQNIPPSFIEMESKLIDDEKFSIVFPSIPRRTTIKQTLEGQKINIVSYQADDGIGLYTFSIGVSEEILSNELAKKSYVEKVFRSLFSGAIDGKIYTLEQSNKKPYEISYLYTSVFKGVDWAHMGMIFLLDENTYVKITLIYPMEKIDIAIEKYSEFLNSLKIK